MPQGLLPIFPESSTHVNNIIAFEKRNGSVYYFNGCMPIFQHSENDLISFKVFTSQLYINGNCTQREIVDAFGVTSISVKRAVKKYREEGIDGFFKKKFSKRKATVLTPEVLVQAQSLLSNGYDKKEVAKELGVKINTLSKSIHNGKLLELEKKS